MGVFITADELRSALSDNDEVQRFTTDQLEDRFILPLEREIEEVFRLDLDTDNDPRYWAGYFDVYPQKRVDFQNDFRRCVILLAERTLTNPHGFASESVGGSSVTFGSSMPRGVKIFMKRWRKPRRIFRA